MEAFNQIFEVLNNTDNSIYVLIVYLLACALAIILRIIVCIGYQTQFALFKLNAKDIKSKSEIKNVRSGFLNKVINDYIRMGDKSVVPNTEMIITKHMLRFNFIGLSYRSVEELIKAIEQNSIFIGIILTLVFENYRYVFAVSAIGAFFILKLFSAVFDYASAREKLLRESVEYLEREVGQFYAGDMGSIFLRLKNEMSAAILKQSENLGDSIKKLGLDLAGVIQLSMQEMSKTIDNTMGRVASFDDELIKPLEKWKKVLEETADSQHRITLLVNRLGDVGTDFEKIIVNMEKGLKGYSDLIEAQSRAVRENNVNLGTISEVIKETSEPLVSAVDTIQAQLKYMERNQNILDSSIQKYEITLEDITRKMGDALGSIIDFHMQSSYNQLNKGLEDNIKNVINANNGLMQRLQDIFEQVLNQSRSEAQAILKIKEQMDMQFESLRERL